MTVFNVKDTNGVFGTPNAWVDLLQYWAYTGGLSDTDNDIDGPNTGRNMDGTMIRDRVAIKHKVNFTSIPVDLAKAQKLRKLVRPETFTVQTDYFDGSTSTYTMYSNNRVVEFIYNHPTLGELAKVTFPLIEV